MELSARKKQILKRVIEDYIASAEPVGSKAIAQEMGGSVSSATVRNELAEPAACRPPRATGCMSTS